MARRSRFGRIAMSVAMFPVTALLVLFAVSNRHTVDVNLWPLLHGIDLPLYLVSLLVMGAGFLVGGLVAWWAAGDSRKRMRSAEREVRALQAKLKAADDGRAAARAVTPAAAE